MSWKAKYCPKCEPNTSLGVPPVFNYCSECGGRLVDLPELPKCKRCKHELRKESKFCRNCGFATNVVQ